MPTSTVSSVVTKKKDKLVSVLKDLLIGRFKMPKLHFNRKLFLELINESAVKHGAKEIIEPKVEFKEGPINFVLGLFNFKTKVITIDYLEVFIFTLLNPLKSQEELENLYKEKITDTLAHEAGHWVLDMVEGIAAIRETWRMQLCYFLLFLVPYFFTGWGLIDLFLEFISSLYGINLFTGIFVGSIVAICGLLILVLMTVINVIIAGILSKIVTYEKCKHEKFARSYANEIKNDPRWGNVIKCTT